MTEFCAACPDHEACATGWPCKNAPKWVDLFGIDPDYTDGLPVDEWLEQNRGEA